MKCKKCGRDMRRQKVDGRKFRYVCPVCGNVVKGNEREDSEDYELAYKTVMGKMDQ